MASNGSDTVSHTSSMPSRRYRVATAVVGLGLLSLTMGAVGNGAVATAVATQPAATGSAAALPLGNPVVRHNRFQIEALSAKSTVTLPGGADQIAISVVESGEGISWRNINSGASVKVDVKAPRVATAGPAGLFNGNTTTSINNMGPGNQPPKALNWAWVTTISIGGHDFPVDLGQGGPNAQGKYPIYFGGQGWTAADNGTTLVTPGGQYAVHVTTNNEYFGSPEFAVTPNN